MREIIVSLLVGVFALLSSPAYPAGQSIKFDGEKFKLEASNVLKMNKDQELGLYSDSLNFDQALSELDLDFLLSTPNTLRTRALKDKIKFTTAKDTLPLDGKMGLNFKLVREGAFYGPSNGPGSITTIENAEDAEVKGSMKVTKVKERKDGSKDITAKIKIKTDAKVTRNDRINRRVTETVERIDFQAKLKFRCCNE